VSRVEGETNAMPDLLRRVTAAAPAVAFVLLLLILVTRGAGVQAPSWAEAYHEEVAAAIERVPYKIGDWVGTDVDVPPAAQQLLRPNKLMQRRYRNIETGRTFNVLIVHCKDSRDLVGHFPPVCYPANGWSPQGVQDASFALASGTFPARVYEFNRIVDGVEQRLRVFSFFVVPSGEAEIASDYDSLSAASRDRRLTGLGAAQLQLIGGEGFTEAERQAVIDEFIQALEPVIRLIGEGMQA
jgi:hypothetical protein